MSAGPCPGEHARCACGWIVWCSVEHGDLARPRHPLCRWCREALARRDAADESLETLEAGAEILGALERSTNQKGGGDA